MADGSDFPGSAYVINAGRLSALESDIRCVARATYRAEPTLEQAATLARKIAANSWCIEQLADAVTWGDCARQPWHATLLAYCAGRAELATPGALVKRLEADMEALDAESTAADERADASDLQAAAQADPREAEFHASLAVAQRVRAADFHAQARKTERNWHAARRAVAQPMQVAA